MPHRAANLKRLTYFVAVVETGSFTAAAEKMGITKAVVSQQVARLEESLQTSLLTRTTRSVLPTQAGWHFYHRCAAVLRDADEAFDELAQSAEQPTGTLRLTAPLDYGMAVVMPAIAQFSQTYPQCQVDAIYSDKQLDLHAGDAELGIRVGWLHDLNVQARQLATFEQVLVASAQWAEQANALHSPAELAQLPFIANTAMREPLLWQFSATGTSTGIGINASNGASTAPSSSPLASVHVHMQARIHLNETLAVREAARLHLGLAILPDYVAAPDLKTGRLQRILPQWHLPTGGIHAVFPAARFRPRKVRAFVEVLQHCIQARSTPL